MLSNNLIYLEYVKDINKLIAQGYQISIDGNVMLFSKENINLEIIFATDFEDVGQ